MRRLLLLRLKLAISVRCGTACPVIVAVVSKCVIVVVVIIAQHKRIGSGSTMHSHRLAIQHRCGLRPAAQRRAVVPRQHGGKQRSGRLVRGRDMARRHQRRRASPLAACRRRGGRRCSGGCVVSSKSRGARGAQRRHRHSCRLGRGCRRPRGGHGHRRAAHGAPAAPGRLHGSGRALRESAGAQVGASHVRARLQRGVRDRGRSRRLRRLLPGVVRALWRLPPCGGRLVLRRAGGRGA